MPHKMLHNPPDISNNESPEFKLFLVQCTMAISVICVCVFFFGGVIMKHFLWLLYFSSFLAKDFFFYVLRSTIAHLYPKIIHFDVVDFSQCCSREVISFFWRAVHKH